MPRQTSELMKLSGSTDGKQIKVTGTGTGSTVTAHTAHATALDLIWLYAYNSDTVDRTLTIEWGETANTITMTVPTKESVEVFQGDLLTNSLTVKAFASVADVIYLRGQVERVSANG